jgi:hypothetical protein
VVGGKLMGGFGLVAWPAEYGVSGIHTFIVSHNGTVFEKDIERAGGKVPMASRLSVLEIQQLSSGL